MAMLDDPDWLLQHIRHSFITSDDTGMCEMVLQDSDMLTLTQHKERIRLEKEDKRKEQAMKTQKKGLPESFGRSTPVGSPKEDLSDANGNSIETTSRVSDSSGNISPIAPSPDIQSGWDFGGRRRSNTAQKLERIKRDKQNRIKVNSIPWRKKNYEISEEEFNYMFKKKELRPRNMCKKGAKTSTDSTDDDISKPGFLPIMTSLINTTLTNDTADQLACVTIPSDEDVESKRSSITDDLIETNQKRTREFVKSKSHSSERIGRPRGLSALSKLLTESAEQYNNPFREYSRFDGEGQSAPQIRKISIFVWPYGMEKPKFSILIHVLPQRAKVQDVIGLTCWKYSIENHEPPLSGTTVQRFALHIAEDDGTIDEDFPPLDANEPFVKFKFTTLALVEKIPTNKTSQNGTNEESGVKETVFVKVNDYEGFSMVKVDNLNITMGEILRRTLTRRKGKNFVGKYFLEYQDRRGEAVNQEQTLESTGVMEFYLVREHSSRPHTLTNAFNGDISSLDNGISSPGSYETGYTFPPKPTQLLSPAPTPPASGQFIFVPTTEYVTFRLNLVRKIRSSVPVDFGVGLHQVDIVSVERRNTSNVSFSLLPHPKNMTIRVGMLAHCEMTDPKTRSNSISVSPPSSSGSPTSSKSSFANFDSWSSSSRVCEKMRLKLYYRVAKNNHIDYKHLTLEGPSDDIGEAVDKVNKIMALCGDRKLQNAFQTHKFGMLSSTTSSSTSTLRRRNSLFR